MYLNLAFQCGLPSEMDPFTLQDIFTALSLHSRALSGKMTPFQKVGSARKQEDLLKMLTRSWSLAQDALRMRGTITLLSSKSLFETLDQASCCFVVEGNVSQ